MLAQSVQWTSGEFLCPLCQCFSNSVTPLLPPVCSSVPSEQPRDNVRFSEWNEIVRLAVELSDSDNVLEGTADTCLCVCMCVCGGGGVCCVGVGVHVCVGWKKEERERECMCYDQCICVSPVSSNVSPTLWDKLTELFRNFRKPPSYQQHRWEGGEHRGDSEVCHCVRLVYMYISLYDSTHVTQAYMYVHVHIHVYVLILCICTVRANFAVTMRWEMMAVFTQCAYMVSSLPHTCRTKSAILHVHIHWAALVA